MAQNELEITLKVVDEASNRIKGVLSETEREVQKVGASSAQASQKVKGFNEQLKQSSRDLRNLRQTAFIATAALALVIKSVGDAAKYNKEAATTFDKFKTSVTSLSVTLGQMLAPALEGVTHVVNFLRDALEAAVAGAIKLGTFTSEFFTNLKEGPVDAYRRAIEVANLATDEFLNKIEQTRANVEGGVTLEPIKVTKVRDDFDQVKAGMQQLQQVADSLRESLSKSVSGPLAEMIKGAKTAKEAFANMGASLVDVIVDFIAETIVAATIGRAIQNIATALSIAQANILAAAWLPAATFAAIATAGGAAAAGTAGIGASLGSAATLAAAASQSLLLGGKKFHKGGIIRAHNGLAVDEVPIIAQTGEGILSRSGMSALGGAGKLARLNRGQGFDTGGINVTIYYPQMNSREDIGDLAEELGREIERTSRYARSLL